MEEKIRTSDSVIQPEKLEKPFQNIYDSLAHTAARLPEKIGVIDSSGKVTFKELKQKVDRVADGLEKTYGLHPGDAVGLLMGNSISFLCAFYAIAKLGCVAVVLNTKQQWQGLARNLEETGAVLLLAQNKWQEKASRILQQGAVKNILFETMGEGVSFSGFVKQQGEIPQRQAFQNKNATVVVMYTSGTTGPPKGALISHENILATAAGYQQMQQLTQDDITVLSVPIFHILGLSCVSTLMVYLGATLVLEPSFNTEKTLLTLSHYKATHFHAAPTVYIHLARQMEQFPLARYNLSSLRICVCGGAFIATSDKQRFCFFVPHASFRLAYGMTETAGGGLLSQGHNQPLRACPGVGVMIADENFAPLPVGATGQILLKGLPVIAGYCKGRGSESFVDGWLCSGDLGSMNAEGYIEIQGRLKEMVNRGGEKIYPSTVEEAISAHPMVEQAAVFALPDSLYGEVPAAAVTLCKGQALSARQLQDFLADKLAKYEIPVEIEFLQEIPYTASGKVAKAQLAKELSEKWGKEKQS